MVCATFIRAQSLSHCELCLMLRIKVKYGQQAKLLHYGYNSLLYVYLQLVTSGGGKLSLIKREVCLATRR